jgi:hypothetical protein
MPSTLLSNGILVRFHPVVGAAFSPSCGRELLLLSGGQNEMTL